MANPMIHYRLTAETVRFLISALRYAESLLHHQLAVLRNDPFLHDAIQNDKVFFSLPIYKEYSEIHHTGAWFDCAFIVMDGDNRNNLKFMMAFTEELKATQKRPIELKQEVYEITMQHNMAEIKTICYIYLEHLQTHRNLISIDEKISLADVQKMDKTLAQLSDIMESDLFSGVDALPLAILSSIVSSNSRPSHKTSSTSRAVMTLTSKTYTIARKKSALLLSWACLAFSFLPLIGIVSSLLSGKEISFGFISIVIVWFCIGVSFAFIVRYWAKTAKLVVSSNGIDCNDIASLVDSSTTWENIRSVEVSQMRLFLVLKKAGTPTTKLLQWFKQSSSTGPYIIDLSSFIEHWKTGELKLDFEKYAPHLLHLENPSDSSNE